MNNIWRPQELPQDEQTIDPAILTIGASAADGSLQMVQPSISNASGNASSASKQVQTLDDVLKEYLTYFALVKEKGSRGRTSVETKHTNASLRYTLHNNDRNWSVEARRRDIRSTMAGQGFTLGQRSPGSGSTSCWSLNKDGKSHEREFYVSADGICVASTCNHSDCADNARGALSLSTIAKLTERRDKMRNMDRYDRLLVAGICNNEQTDGSDLFNAEKVVDVDKIIEAVQALKYCAKV